MKFCNFLFKMNLGKDCSIGTIASIMSLVCLLANLTIIASEKKVIKEPKPLNRPYETMVDYAMFIDHEQETKSVALQSALFTSVRACTGIGLNEEKRMHGQYVIIATMPVVSSLFYHIDPIYNIPDWNKLLPHINTYIDTYTTDDQSFVVFIPKNYKEGELQEDGTKITFSDQEKQLKYIGFNPQALKPFNINGIKPNEDQYQYLPNKAQEIDVKKLESIFIPDAKIARCIYLLGHGGFKISIADMEKATYLKFLELLEKLDTRFLYIVSCYSGGINTVVMNMRLKEDFRDTLALKQEKSFDILNIHFPIVVQATSDAITYGHILSFDNEKLFFLNNFFSTLHAFLSSPTWEIGMKKSEWRELMGKKLIATKTKELIEKHQRSPEEEEELEKLSKLIKTPKVAGPLVFMSDVLKQIYSVDPSIYSKLNLPSIYIPDCKEIPGGIFFEAVKVDSMEIITNKNLTSNILIADRERKRIISEKGEIKEQGLTEEEKIKQAKFVLVYPVDMSSTTFTITCNEPPTFISKIGGNAYHIIGTYHDEIHNFVTIIKSFIYPQYTSPKSFSMGASNKAWLIGHLREKTEVVDYIVLYKPAEIDYAKITFDSLVMYPYKNNYYMNKMHYTHTKDYPYFNFSLGQNEIISPAYYASYLKAILKNCAPDPLALEKFTASKETPETISVAAHNFSNSAVPSITITMDDIKKSQKILSESDSHPIARQATFELLGELGKQSKELLDQTVNSMQLKDNNTVLHLAIEAGVDKDILKNLITDKSIVAQNSSGLPPLHYAIDKNADKDIIKLLVNDDSLKTQTGYGLTPLHIAIDRDADKDIIKLLVNADSLKAQSKSGLTPLHIGLKQKADKDIIKLLINDDSLKAQDIYGYTPLVYAIQGLADKDIIKLLINDDSLKIQAKDGTTPLHMAIDMNADKDIIESLITSETINIKNNDGITPLQVAIKNGAGKDIIDLLKKHGAK